MERGGKQGTRREEENEGEFVWLAVLETHPRVEGKTFVGLVLRGVRLDELVEEEDSRCWNKVEQVLGIRDVRYLEESHYETLGLVVYA